jgi:hypothetical protein
MIVLHRKTLAGAEVASLPDLSMQFVRRASHYPREKNAADANYVDKSAEKKNSKSAGHELSRFDNLV